MCQSSSVLLSDEGIKSGGFLDQEVQLFIAPI